MGNLRTRGCDCDDRVKLSVILAFYVWIKFGSTRRDAAPILSTRRYAVAGSADRRCRHSKQLQPCPQNQEISVECLVTGGPTHSLLAQLSSGAMTGQCAVIGTAVRSRPVLGRARDAPLPCQPAAGPKPRLLAPAAPARKSARKSSH